MRHREKGSGQEEWRNRCRKEDPANEWKKWKQGKMKKEWGRNPHTDFNTPLKLFIYRGSGLKAEHRYCVCGNTAALV